MDVEIMKHKLFSTVYKAYQEVGSNVDSRDRSKVVLD